MCSPVHFFPVLVVQWLKFLRWQEREGSFRGQDSSGTKEVLSWPEPSFGLGASHGRKTSSLR